MSMTEGLPVDGQFEGDVKEFRDFWEEYNDRVGSFLELNASGILSRIVGQLRMALMVALSMDDWPPHISMRLTVGKEAGSEKYTVVIPKQISKDVDLIEHGTHDNGKYTIHRFLTSHSKELEVLTELDLELGDMS